MKWVADVRLQVGKRNTFETVVRKAREKEQSGIYLGIDENIILRFPYRKKL
jgi:hypothetical protein